MPALPDDSLEKSYPDKTVAGIDEAGRGPLAGPVVAACAYIAPQKRALLEGVHDSKKLSEKKRDAFYDLILEHADVGVSIMPVEVIDQINILQATKRAMCEAYTKLPTPTDVVLVDGNQRIDVPCICQTVVKGDATSLSIAAASIVAKVTRDRLMQELHKSEPHYAWNSNAGYGTKAHLEAIEIHGISAHHRKTFAPIRDMLREPKFI